MAAAAGALMFAAMGRAVVMLVITLWHNPHASTAMLQILGQAPRVVWPRDVAEQKFVFPRPRA